MKINQLCQRELDRYSDFHKALRGLCNPGRTMGAPAIYFQDDKFKATFESLATSMMMAESGDELLSNHQTFKTLLEKQVDKGRITELERHDLFQPIDDLCQVRGQYLPKPFKHATHAKGALGIGIGTALITTALVLSVVGAPLAPAAAVGGAVLAYGLADNSKQLAESFDEKSKEQLSKMHHHNFDAFKQELENPPSQKTNLESYLTQHKVQQASPKSDKNKTLKKWGKRLSIAGLGLAVAALIAVFPPVGIPIAVGITVGAVSTGMIAVAGGVYTKDYLYAKSKHKAIVNQQHVTAQEGIQLLDDHYDKISIQQNDSQKSISNDNKNSNAKPNLKHTTIDNKRTLATAAPGREALNQEKINFLNHQGSHSEEETDHLFKTINNSLMEHLPHSDSSVSTTPSSTKEDEEEEEEEEEEGDGESSLPHI